MGKILTTVVGAAKQVRRGLTSHENDVWMGRIYLFYLSFICYYYFYSLCNGHLDGTIFFLKEFNGLKNFVVRDGTKWLK